MSEVKPYTLEEIAEFSDTVAGQRLEAARHALVLGHAARWLATLAAVEAERDAALAEVERLREALRSLTSRVPVMGTRGDYREGQQDALNRVARACESALAPQPEVKGEQP